MVTKAGVKQGFSSTPVVIDARHIQGADFTTAKVSSVEEVLKQNMELQRCTYHLHLQVYVRYDDENETFSLK